MTTTRTTGVGLALRQASIRATVTIAGLAVYWQLGMQDLHSLTKAAAFILIANFGLAGLQLLHCHRRMVAIGALLLNSLVILNASVEGCLFWLYGLAPKNIVVADAILGSNTNETREFIETYWMHLSLVAALSIALIVLLCWVERRFNTLAGNIQDGRRRARWLGLAMLTLFAAMHLNTTMAQENPLIYWPGYFVGYQEQREFLNTVKTKVASDLAALKEADAIYMGPERHTLVLVLGESVNRNNWSLYGYPRKTTPQLDLIRKDITVFKNVLSSDASTVASLLKMLSPATLDLPDAWAAEPNVLALARKAGYHVVWLSNQEKGDGQIQILAEHAHEQIFVNNGHGRAARSLDERLLPQLAGVLAGPAPRKLVVVHMQGAHLRYDLRYPAAFDRFTGVDDDKVSDSLKQATRPFWIRRARNEYDNAMLYTDHVIASIIRASAKASSVAATTLLYVSDHGQEVGHYRNFSGHSSTDPSGYQVPLLLWTSGAQPLSEKSAALGQRPYRTDNLDHTLLGLLQIRTRFYDASNDLLSPRFVRSDPHPRLSLKQ